MLRAEQEQGWRVTAQVTASDGRTQDARSLVDRLMRNWSRCAGTSIAIRRVHDGLYRWWSETEAEGLTLTAVWSQVAVSRDLPDGMTSDCGLRHVPVDTMTYTCLGESR